MLGYSASTSRRLDVQTGQTTSFPLALEAGLGWSHASFAVFGAMGSTAGDNPNERDSLLRVGFSSGLQWQPVTLGPWDLALAVGASLYLFEETTDRDPTAPVPVTIVGGFGGCLQPSVVFQYGHFVADVDTRSTILSIEVGPLLCDEEVNRSLSHPNYHFMNEEHSNVGGVVRLRVLIPFSVAP